MTTLAPRAGAEAGPVAADFAVPYRQPVGALVGSPGQFQVFSSAEQMAEAIAAGAAFPAWSSLSWEERAEYIARYCR